MEKENPYIEYKEDSNRSYLKTVSYYANYHTGTIVFGVTDATHEIKPISDVKSFCENIENQINDSIKPHPDFSFKPNPDGTINLVVYKGENTPYFYHGKAYKRNDTSSTEMDDFELKRKVLESQHLNFEEIKSNRQDLAFTVLEEKLKEAMNLSSFSIDTLKTLELYSDKNGYNVAAALLADQNDFYGIDIAVFGESENIIQERISLSGISVIKQYFESIEVFERNYCYEEIEGSLRVKKERIPKEAFREAIANALVHRTWDVRANIKVSMYQDHIVVSSPGGLPFGISKDQYLSGDFSLLRNPILAHVFHRLGIIEAFATGIKRINSTYEGNYEKPIFKITDGSIVTELPLIKREPKLTKEETNLLNNMIPRLAYSRAALEKVAHCNKAKMIRLLNGLFEKGFIIKEGKSSSTAYIRLP